MLSYRVEGCGTEPQPQTARVRINGFAKSGAGFPGCQRKDAVRLASSVGSRESPTIRPEVVFGSQPRYIGPARRKGTLQLEPPFGVEMKPTFSLHFVAVQPCPQSGPLQFAVG